jgi:hypothetical protein
VSEHPQCAAVLQDGSRCRSVTVSDTEFCQHHGDVASGHGTDAVKNGEHLPVRRKRVVQNPVRAEISEALTSSGTTTIDPATVRPRLAEAAAERLDDLQRVLLETATGANKNLWATVSCKHCGRAGRYEIVVPDNKVRLDAVQALLHEALGRPAQAETQRAPSLPQTAEELHSLSWDQLTLIFASQFAGEISSVMNGGGDLLLQRLGALGSDERRILREALAEPGLV